MSFLNPGDIHKPWTNHIEQAPGEATPRFRRILLLQEIRQAPVDRENSSVLLNLQIS